MTISQISSHSIQLRKALFNSLAIPALLLTSFAGLTPTFVMANQADSTSATQSTEILSILDFESLEQSGQSVPPDMQQSAAETGSLTEDDKCDMVLVGRPWQEKSQQVLYGISCHSFRWFDHLFGSKEDFPEEQVNGLLLLGFDYRQYDSFDPRTRFRVRAPLPNLTSRWDLIIGRENEEEYVTDTAPTDSTLFNPGLSRDADNEWLLGLGYRQKSRRKGFDYSVGLRLGAPPNLYGKVQYYYNRQYSEKTDLRFRQTLFWRTDEGLGTTSRANIVHQASTRNVVRLEGVATVSEDTEGMKWYTAQTWYHQLHGKNAISLQAFAQGETNQEVPLRDYGLNLIWRQPFTRDWMFLSMGPNITWPRTFRNEERELSLGFSLWVEMEFGDYDY